LILDFSGGENDSTYLPHLKKNCGSKYVSTSSPLLKTMDKKGILVKNARWQELLFWKKSWLTDINVHLLV